MLNLLKKNEKPCRKYCFTSQYFDTANFLFIMTICMTLTSIRPIGTSIKKISEKNEETRIILIKNST